jgi:hypothetical protein
MGHINLGELAAGLPDQLAGVDDTLLLVSQALARLDVLARYAAQEIIGRGQVRVFALRSDIFGGTTPEPVKELLANATRATSREMRSRCFTMPGWTSGRSSGRGPT